MRSDARKRVSPAAQELTEAERELLSGLCDNDAWRGVGEDGYCYAHHAPVKWAGHANASDVCCLAVEDYVERVLALRRAL